MLLYVDPQFRTQWGMFLVQDSFAAEFNQTTSVMSVSNEMLGVMLNNVRFRGLRYALPSNTIGAQTVSTQSAAQVAAARLGTPLFAIGYGIGDPTTKFGLTEPEAYSLWLGNIKAKEKILRSQLTNFALPQGAFDALLSLYVSTGTWRSVIADEGSYNLVPAVTSGNWMLAADMIARSTVSPQIRQRESHIMMLADYGVYALRTQKVSEGLGHTRMTYSSLTIDLERRQAEFSYYRQLGAFIPGMSELQQRKVLAQL